MDTTPYNACKYNSIQKVTKNFTGLYCGELTNAGKPFVWGREKEKSS